MANPNDDARRRRRARQSASVSNHGNYGFSDHPTLTAKGLEMMRTSPLKDESYGMPMPEYQFNGVPIVNEIVPQPLESYSVRPGPFFGSGARHNGSSKALPQNFLTSQKFPDPTTLVSQPLDRYFQTKLASDISDFPSKAIGRMVIHVDPYQWDQPAFGSAWIVGPNLIATCAHNMFDSNKRRWSRAIEFYPGFDYYSDVTPVQCNVTSCYIPKSYLDNPATNDDIGFCYTDQNIGDIVGQTIPIAPPGTNSYFENNLVTIAGYPASSEFDFGKQLWASQGEYLFGRSMGPDDDHSPVLATNFGGGASGGPWIARDRNSNQWTAVGLTSGHARLHYQRGELNLMSLASPMLTQSRMDRLDGEQVFHTFDA